MVELGGIVILGILAQWIAWRLKVPAILPLIITGLIVGPFSTLWTHDGLKLIDPLWNEVLGHGLFPGESLFHFVELGIGIILFEGGLTLKREEIKEVGDTIIRLITLGSLITFIGGAIGVHYFVGLTWPLSFLFAGLIIVTGPTVIAPILRNVPLSRNVSTVLKWEGILIDPIGALVAVLVYEFIISAEGGFHFTSEALQHFLILVCVGLAIGVGSAFLLRFLLKRNFIPHFLLTIFTLAYVLLVYVGSSVLVPDSGLLTVVVSGMVIGNIEVPHIKDISYFKESLSILLISILFILISANINMEDLNLLNNWQCVLTFLLVIIVIRPFAVFISTRNSSLSTKEKIFIGWMGPRGIVAAGIASLLGSKLVQQGMAGAEYITPLVFMVVLGTVILNATTARFLARMLGILLKKSNGVLILGAAKASRLIASYLQKNGRHVVIIDSNKENVTKSNNEGLQALQVNVYGENLANNITFNDMGYLMAMTSSDEVNRFATTKLHEYFGEEGTYRMLASEEINNVGDIGDQTLFSEADDFINLSEVARDYPHMHEVEVESEEALNQILEQVQNNHRSIPIFTKDKNGQIEIISTSKKGFQFDKGMKIIYLGQKVNDSKVEEIKAEDH